MTNTKHQPKHEAKAKARQAVKKMESAQATRTRDADSTKLPELESMHALKVLVLPRASRSGEIALAGSRRLRSTLGAAPVLFAHVVVTVAKNK